MLGKEEEEEGLGEIIQDTGAEPFKFRVADLLSRVHWYGSPTRVRESQVAGEGTQSLYRHKPSLSGPRPGPRGP